MVATIAAGTSAGYYLAQSEYYLGGEEPPGRWIAGGSGFGITAGNRIDRDEFERLHSGIDTDGRSLLSNGGGRLDRVPGYDMTFSAPKSVSVLWSLCGDDLRRQIEAAQADAVVAAIAILGSNAAVSRRGRNGARHDAVALNAAAFQHGEARPTEHRDGRIFADPQLHTHAVILNLGRRADGTVGTLDGRRLFAWKMASGATYHLALATGLQRLGLTVTDIGKNGVFEVAGIDARLAEYFSVRRAEIEDALDEAGLTSAAAPALASAITKASRSAKDSATGLDRFHLWREMAVAQGHDPQRIIRAVHVSPATVNATDRHQTVPEHDIRKRLQDISQQLTETESVFERRQLIGAVATALVGSGASAELIEQETDALVSAGDVVALGTDAIGEIRYSTPDMIRIEREILRIAQRLSAQSFRKPDCALAERLSAEGALNSEQKEAVSAATANTGIVVIEGAAGSGKTTSLRPIVDAHRSAGYRVIGSATAWRIAGQLRDDLRIDARATDAWLSAADNGKSFLDDRTLLVVDEAGQLSSRQMHAVLSEVDRAGAKLLLVGDRRQLQPIGPGGALSIVARVADIARVDRIVRQIEGWARDATMQLAAGETSKALQAYGDRGHVHFHAGAKATVRAIIDAWEAHKTASSEQTLLLARTNGQVREINAEVRKRLRESAVLSGPDVAIDAVSGTDQAYRLHLAAGDEIRFLARNDRLGVINGTTATITAISGSSPARPKITARLQDREIIFTPDDIADEIGKAKLGHAYASTIYGAQGLTADRSLILLDPVCNRHDTYVGLSRARHATDIFVDQTLIDAGIRAERPLSERSISIVPDDAARICWLGEKLSRSAIKHSTIDLIAHPDAARTRQRRSLPLDPTMRNMPEDLDRLN